MSTNNETFIKATSVKLGIDEEIVYRIISHQWKSAKEATALGSIIEITGMGRFQVRMTKVEKVKYAFNNYYKAAVRTLESLDKDKDLTWYPTFKKVKGIESDLEYLSRKKENQTKSKQDEEDESIDENTGRDD